MYTAEQCYELALLMLCIWREARGESDEAKLGVAWTIKNRVALQSWMGKSYVGVILKPFQFSSFNGPDHEGRVDANSTKFPIPTTDPSFGPCLMAAKRAYEGTSPDPTAGATHYYDDSIAPPSWTAAGTPTVVLGKLHFYKDIK